MPRQPEFKYPFDLPFQLKWVPEGAFWSLDLPAEMAAIEIDAYLEDEFTTGRRNYLFGTTKLKPICALLQGYLDTLHAEHRHPQDGILDHDILGRGGVYAVTGQHSWYLAWRHEIGAKLSRRGYVHDQLGGLTESEMKDCVHTLELIRDTTVPNAPLPEGFIEPQIFSARPPSHGRVSGQILDQVMRLPELSSERDFYYRKLEGLLLPYWRYQDFADLVRPAAEAQEARVTELHAAISAAGCQEITPVAKIGRSRFSIDIAMTPQLSNMLQEMKMRRHGLSLDQAPGRRHGPLEGKPRVYGLIPREGHNLAATVADVTAAMTYIAKRHAMLEKAAAVAA